jgi:hypothetical protein
MSWVGFEPTIPAFEQAKTFHALGRTGTVIGWPVLLSEPMNAHDCEHSHALSDKLLTVTYPKDNS